MLKCLKIAYDLENIHRDVINDVVAVVGLANSMTSYQKPS